MSRRALTRAWRLAVALVALIGLTPARAEPPPLVLALAGDVAPAWRGIGADEAAGAQGLGMLYPAPNAAGLLAAILTHALLVDSQRSAARDAAQAEADKVLAPHAAAIAALQGEALMAAVRQALPAPVQEASRGKVVQMQPRFALAADARTLVLDNVIRVHDAETAAVARFENTVRVIATPRGEDDPQARWAADEGRALRDEGVALLAHSVQIALAPLPAPDAQAFRTQRYRFGTAQKMERGQPVAEGCARVVLRTLRDWLMSVPVAVAPDAAACEPPYSLRRAG
jgi:hypothetical protein